MNQHREEVRAKWRNLISEQEESGQRVAAFCLGRGLPRRQFYYWKKQLRRTASSPFVELQVARPYAKEKSSRSMPAATIEVRLSNGRSLMVAPEFDASHLRSLLAVVESV
jgi:transposase-like protein